MTRNGELLFQTRSKSKCSISSLLIMLIFFFKLLKRNYSVDKVRDDGLPSFRPGVPTPASPRNKTPCQDNDKIAAGNQAVFTALSHRPRG